jgi:hypothetical protein
MVRGRFLRQRGQMAATPLIACRADRAPLLEIGANFRSYDK